MGATNAARSLKALAAAALAACAIALCAALPSQAWAATSVDSNEALKSAIESGETDINLADGTYQMPDAKGKTLKISGTHDAVIEVVPSGGGEAGGQLDYSLDGAFVEFNGVTIKTNSQLYAGYARLSAVYNDCVIQNTYNLGSGTSEFNNCEFNITNEYLRVGGATSASFTGCTFNTDGRAILVYQDGTSVHQTVTVKDCTFNATAAAHTWNGIHVAPVSIDGSQGGTYTVNLEGNNVVDSDFNGLWQIKGGDEVITVSESGKQVHPFYVAQIGDTKYTSLQKALDTAAAGTGEVTVEILENVNLAGVDWNPVTVSAPGYPKVTVNGNNHIITNLNDMLFAGTWAGKSGLIINDLTIKDSNIVNDENDSKGTVGVGAFIGYPQASSTITLSNCHLVDSSVKGGHWTGGLIGAAAGYAGNDGPVFMNLTITGCSVTGSTITGKGSAGGIIGHGSQNGWSKVVIENTEVKGNVITSTGSSSNKAGSVMGTLGAAGQPTTAAGETKTGGAFVEAIVSGNDVASNGAVITTIYGRQGTPTGILTLTKGGSYDKDPINAADSWANPAEDHMLMKRSDGTWTVLPENCTVTFVVNGGSAVASATVAGGEPFAKPADPTREGYTFGGWYADEACTVAYDFTAPAAGDITLYAKWTKVNAGDGDQPTGPTDGDKDDKDDGKSESKDALAKTGDATGVVAAGAGVALAAAGAIALIARRRAA